MQLRQHAVHSNGTQTITYTGCVNIETAYGQCSNTGCSNYSQSGCSNHTNYSKSSYSQSGYSNHSNTGYSNHSNSSTTTWNYTNSAASSSSWSTMFNENIPSYVLNSSLSDKGVNLAANTIVIDLSSAYSGGQKYRIYVRHANLGDTTFGDWQLVTEQEQISTFSVDISTWSQGKVQFAVTAYNGSSWSAILVDNNWTYDHHQSLTPYDYTTITPISPSTSHTGRTGVTTIREVLTVSDTTQYEITGGSYALSDILQIIRYTPPIWLADPYAKATTQQLQNEINKALDSYTGVTYIFASSPIVCNWTRITLNNLAEMQAQTNNILTAAGKSTVDFSSKDYMNGTSKISPDKALKDLQDLLDSLGE